MPVTGRGRKVAVVLNGQRVIDMDLDAWTEPKKNPDGTPNQFFRALKDFGRRGHVGFQDHGLLIGDRNLRIRPLDAADIRR